MAEEDNDSRNMPINAADIEVVVSEDEIREDMVSTAVRFLNDSTIVDTPTASKRTFLLEKGLTPPEVTAAVERSKLNNHPSEALLPSNSLRAPVERRLINVGVKVTGMVAAIGGVFKAARAAASISSQMNAFQVQMEQLTERLRIQGEVIDDAHRKITEMVNSNATIVRRVDAIEAAIHTASPPDEVKRQLKEVKTLLLNATQLPPMPPTFDIPLSAGRVDSAGRSPDEATSEGEGEPVDTSDA